MAAARRPTGPTDRAHVQSVALSVAARVGAECQSDAVLAPHLSMRIGGRAAALLSPRDVEQVVALVRELRASGVPTKILGGGSNLLVEEGDLEFVVVRLGAVRGRVTWTGPRALASAGTPLAAVLREAMKRGLRGLEWAAGLPGSIGGAVVGNAGAFGGETGAHVRAVTLLTQDGDLVRRETGPEDFGYRRSFVRPGEAVLEVEVELDPGDPDAIRREVDRVNRARVAGQPKGGHSSGCVFKNPPGDHAGRLIDSCGLKGLAVGGAVVSSAHANFVVNEGGATTSDVLELVERVRSAVRSQTGIDLEPEIRIWHRDGTESGPHAAAPEGDSP